MSVQVENAHVKLIRELRLSRSQQADMAACWNAWLKQRTALNHFHTSCHNLLDTLPASLQIPWCHLRHIEQLASGTVTRGAAARLCIACMQKCHGGTGRMHEGCACTCKCCGGTNCGGAVGWAGAVDACTGCGGAVVGEEAKRPLGADVDGMCRAAEALRVLWRMQDSETDVAVTLVALQQQPGPLQDAWQLARVYRTNLEQRGPVFDTLLLCQLAAMQVRRNELRRWPAVLGKPLPERM